MSSKNTTTPLVRKIL